MYLLIKIDYEYDEVNVIYHSSKYDLVYNKFQEELEKVKKDYKDSLEDIQLYYDRQHDYFTYELSLRRIKIIIGEI